MIAFFKSLPLAIILTLVVTLFLGAGGASGGKLAVFGFTVDGMHFYWSWILFLCGLALTWALMWMMGD